MACHCLEAGPRAPDIDDVPRYIGVDENEGRFADVALGAARGADVYLPGINTS